MSNKFPESASKADLAAMFLLQQLYWGKTSYEINSDGRLIFPGLVTNKLPIDEIISEFHALCVKTISDKDLREIKSESDYEGEFSNQSDWEDLYWKYLSSEACSAFASLLDLLRIIEVQNSEDWWEEYLDLKNSGKILWVNTFRCDYALDNLNGVAEVYMDCPFRSKKLEYHFLRAYMYLYANNACFDFHFGDRFLEYDFNGELKFDDLVSGRFQIYKGSILTTKKYVKDKESRLLNVLRILTPPVLIFALLSWYFEFPSWADPEFYMSLLVALLLGDQHVRKTDKYKTKIFEKDKTARKIIINFYKKMQFLMSFSVERNDSLVDEFLDKSLTVLEFKIESIRMTESVKALLYRKKYEGEFRIEDPEG